MTFSKKQHISQTILLLKGANKLRFFELGEENNPAIVLIHGYGVSWKMWQPHIEILKKDYRLIVPALPGHDLGEKSTFLSVEDTARQINDYIQANLQGKVRGMIGCSLGGTIAVEIMAQGQIQSEIVIIDAGPVEAISKPLRHVFAWIRTLQNRLIRKGNKTVLNALTNSYFTMEAVEDLLKTAEHMSVETCRNVQFSVFGYTVPDTIAKSGARFVYWYGSKEAILLKKSVRTFAKYVPGATIQVFEGYNHGELVVSNPDLFVKNATMVINSNPS
ncbi:Pimeloyl-ACP methyl ester carboxylesterase [Tindallia californiensis]|uniref:Pimeloyl-ACP methyl ester carboxylesterase n=1 Tax=Tindallia californiensis TaxID=159292 RepID=A0A1H3PRF6_9FIRM|nr:Pimeloyl-ACP methyl ester carboxylesterase [Tindallia californiensis]